MKTKIWNTKNTAAITATGNWISIKPKSGTMGLSRDLCRSIGLKSATMINFIQNEEKPREWFIEITKDPASFRLREHKVNKSCILQSIVLARAIFSSLGLDNETTYRIPISTTKDEHNRYPLITSNAKKVNHKEYVNKAVHID